MVKFVKVVPYEYLAAYFVTK